MRFNSIACLLLLAATTAFGFNDEWSWAVEGKESVNQASLPVPAESSLSSSFSSSSSSSSSSSRDGHSLISGPPVSFGIDSLPLEDEYESLVYEGLPLEDQYDSVVYEVLPLASEGESLAVESLPYTAESLPLEPHGSISLSVVGEGDLVDGLVVAEDSDREGRFLGLGDKLCSFGIGLNCAKNYPLPGKLHHAPSKVGGSHGSYGPPSPVKTHYGQKRPAVPQGTYGAPVHHRPPPPVLPNRGYNVQAPTKAPFSAFNGLLSVLKPFMQASKPKAPPKVSQGGFLRPSYTAPNPNYAPLLPSYAPPVKPTYAAPTPSYFAPAPAYSQPKPAYVAPKPSYATPSVYVAPKPSYAAPSVHYSHNKPVHFAPKPVHAAPKPTYDPVQPSYSAPKRVYIEPKPIHAKAVPTVTVHAHPTVVEQHHHTHTHVYNDKTVHGGIYKDDHNGVLQSVHDSINQVNQHILQRQETRKISTHETSHNVVQVAQPSVNHVVVQQQIPTSHTPSIVPAVLVGGTNFRPGRIESGFQPSQQVLESVFQQQRPTYREDCQCVAADFCPSRDVIGRNAPADLSNVIDARTRGSDILSNATDSEESTTRRSARKSRVLNLDESIEITESATEIVTEEVTEPATEAATESWTEYENEATEAWTEYEDEATEAPGDVELDEKSRKRRDTNSTSEEEEQEEEEEEEDPAIYTDRQGRQLTGFTPNGHGCGPNYVCCRRPVFKPRRQRYTCGKRNVAGLLGRVKTAHFVQGDTEFGEYPWQAAILKREEGDILYVCGATLIDNRHVLTAAHCVDGIHPSQIKIRLGEWDVSGQTEFYKHVEMRASGVYLHPEFYAGNLNNDIAVIQLENFVDFASYPHITPICLPEKFTDFTHQRCHATGWGKNAFGSDGKFSHVLKEVEVPVLDNQRCQQTLQNTRLGASFALHQGNFCAGGEEGKDTCKGDGGGPLVCPGAEGVMQLAGLVSWGIGCGSSGVPGVYVRVSHYVEWIKSITHV